MLGRAKPVLDEIRLTVLRSFQPNKDPYYALTRVAVAIWDFRASWQVFLWSRCCCQQPWQCRSRSRTSL